MNTVDWSDVQGYILRSYGMRYATHFFVQVTGAARGREFIGRLLDGGDAPQITNGAAWPADARPASALNMGLTFAGLKALGLAPGSVRSFEQSYPAFAQGPLARAARLGDTGASAPDHWHACFRKPHLTHLLLSLYARTDADRSAQTADLEGLFKTHGIEQLMTCHGHQPDDREHFGFRDNLSQPCVAGFPPHKSHTRRDLDNAVQTGAFLLGYDSPWPDAYPLPQPDLLGINGTFAAFRLLEQHVEAFERYLAAMARATRLRKEHIAAKICGRWYDGARLEAGHQQQPPPPATAKLNDFDYSDDPQGLGCPFGAHIRRANPRADPVAGDVRMRRIIRRGMKYSMPKDDGDGGVERGLMGFFIGASLEDQFEFVQSNWVNNLVFDPGAPNSAKDPLVGGNIDYQNRYAFPPMASSASLPGIGRFVTTRGALYCFLPSLSALRFIAGIQVGR